MAGRWPRWVYAPGEEPDPRFSLANERTFLAWIRTALALVAAGVALEALALPVQPVWRTAAAVDFVVLGLLATVEAWLGWARSERAIRTRSVLPGPSLAPVLAAGVALGMVGVGVGIWSR